MLPAVSGGVLLGALAGGRASAREIGGQEIIVVRQKGGRGLFGRGADRRRLEVQSVEGDDVYLEETRAGVVRGSRLKIGPGCKIGAAEYGESLQIDPKAKVERHVYTGQASPPPAELEKF